MKWNEMKWMCKMDDLSFAYEFAEGVVDDLVGRWHQIGEGIGQRPDDVLQSGGSFGQIEFPNDPTEGLRQRRELALADRLHCAALHVSCNCQQIHRFIIRSFHHFMSQFSGLQ